MISHSISHLTELTVKLMQARQTLTSNDLNHLTLQEQQSFVLVESTMIEMDSHSTIRERGSS
jgi:hypothetical protein